MASFAPPLTREPLRENEIATLAAQLMSVVALFVGDEVMLSREEAAELAQPLGRMLSQHTPVQRFIRKGTDPIVLVAVAGKILKTRVARVRARAADRAIRIAALEKERDRLTLAQQQRHRESLQHVATVPPAEPAPAARIAPEQVAAILSSAIDDMASIP
ncbi:MAG: hypothetical protein NVSMB19_15890 [Vulcanimicrobiaceae bacterium]